MDINGINLYYKDMGYGKTVILLHGHRQSSELYKHVDRHLAERYRVILIDSRGQGRSDSGDEPVSVSLMARDVIAVMDKLSIGKATIIGFSDGGNIALQLAVDYPERIRKIIAISANSRPEGMLRSWRFAVRLWKRVRNALHLKTDLIGLLLDEPQISADQLRSLSAPTMLIYGSRDIVGKSHIAMLEEYIPGAKLLIVNGAFHGNIVKKWRKYERDIEEFIKT